LGEWFVLFSCFMTRVTNSYDLDYELEDGGANTFEALSRAQDPPNSNRVPLPLHSPSPPDVPDSRIMQITALQPTMKHPCQSTRSQVGMLVRQSLTGL
jgi:hypothetical protein